MLTLRGSLLGFLSPAFADFLKLWRDHASRKHELAILGRQMESQRQGHNVIEDIQNEKCTDAKPEALLIDERRQNHAFWHMCRR